MGSRHHARRRDDRGTTALEVAGMAPLVVLVIFLLVQAALALYAITTAQTAVRQAARAWSQNNGVSPVRIINESVPGWLEVGAGDVVADSTSGHAVQAQFDIPDVVPFYDLRVTRKTVMP